WHLFQKVSPNNISCICYLTKISPFFLPGSQMFPTPQATCFLGNYQQNFANYQNCTIVRSHVPHANYGTYVKVTPKILIFPIFVQPVDLCSPNRTLMISEEIILYESKHFSIKVTIFIYSDLMLVTREDELGRCNVLQNPLYLRQLQLRDGHSEDLRFYLIHMTEKCDCLLSLEANSLEQKSRVCQCLSENIKKQLQLHARQTFCPPQQVQYMLTFSLDLLMIQQYRPDTDVPHQCFVLTAFYIC
uniref:Si:ch211-154e10.1 n=1 Tax=Sinocyclocheilus grahami TaxID=75366 RepID=A0A672PB04_SINGR